MPSYTVTFEDTSLGTHELDALTLESATSKANLLLRHLNSRYSKSPTKVQTVVPTFGRFACRGCNWHTDEPGDVANHVLYCDQVDGAGNKIRSAF